jgi:hypothetical protein
VVTSGGTVAFLGSDAGLQVVDIADPHHPSLLASIPGNAKDVTLTGQHVIVANQSSPYALDFYDVTAPATPLHVATLPMPFPLGNVVAEGAVACASMGTEGLAVVDVSDPASPFIAATVDDTAWNVAIQGSIAAYATGDFEGPGFVLLNVSLPATPVVLGEGGHPGGLGVHLDGALLYHTWTDANSNGYEALLDIYDIGNPSSPIRLGGTVLPASGGVVQAVSPSGYAYVESGSLGLSVLDVSSPSAPFIIGSASAPSDGVFGAALAEDVVLTSTGLDGLQIFPVECSTAGVPAAPPILESTVSLRLAGANPVFGTAKIAMDLADETTVRLTVYDTLGRHVRELFAGRIEAGSHAYLWNGRDDLGQAVARGVYFLQLTTPSGKANARIVWGP